MTAIIQSMMKNVRERKSLFQILTAKKTCFDMKKNNKDGQTIKMKKFGMNFSDLNNF